MSARDRSGPAGGGTGTGVNGTPDDTAAADGTVHDAVNDTAGDGVDSGAGGVDDVPRPRGLGARAAVAAVRWYQVWISPNLLPSCRFHPSCSAYAVEALGVHGLIRGLGLTAWRLLRCGPWHPGGWDPVPPRRRGPAARTQPGPASTEPSPAEGLSRGTDR